MAGVNAETLRVAGKRGTFDIVPPSRFGGVEFYDGDDWKASGDKEIIGTDVNPSILSVLLQPL
jgi:hypothetical protein